MDKFSLIELREKALQAFDYLMNEEILLERLEAKCDFINQNIKDGNIFRAMNLAKNDLMPTNKGKYDRFHASTENIIRKAEKFYLKSFFIIY